MYSQLRLDSLPVESAGELLASLLGPDPGLAPLTQMLVKRGNPFFLEETVRTLVETGALAGERGGYRLTRRVDALQIPATVQAILAARIDRLSPEDKRLLQAASVVGKDVPYALLHAIAELPEDALRAGLARLIAAEFLYGTRLFPDLEHTFKHALTHEVAAAGVLMERRRTLHARVVEAIERLYPERLEEHLAPIGWHALRGELWEQAVDYNRRAGVRAHHRPAYLEAVTAFERAIEAVDHLPKRPDTVEQAIDLRALMRTSLVNSGQPDRSLDVSRELLERAGALGDPKRKAMAATNLVNSLYLCGHSSEAAAAGRDALALAEALGDSGLLVLTRLNFAQACEAVGDHERVIDMMSANLDLHAREPDLKIGVMGGRMFEIMSRTWLALSLAQRGEFDRAAIVAQPAVGLGEHSGLPFWMAGGRWALSLIDAQRGEVESAISHLERGLDLCTSYGIHIYFTAFAGYLGHVYTLDGRLAEAGDLLRQAVEASASGQRAHQSLWLAWLGETHLLLGDLEQAAGLATAALAMARDRGERGNEVLALKLQGDIAAAVDPPASAVTEARYHDARALAVQLRLRPLIAHCHLGLGKLSRRRGQGDQARQHLAIAKRMYREMGMTYWLEKVAAEMPE